MPILPQFLLLISCAAALADTPNTSTPSPLTLYQNPDTHSQIIRTLSPQEGVTIVPVTWVQIRDPHTQQLGWVQQDALRAALQQDPINIQQITSNTQGPYHAVSTIQTVTKTSDEATYRQTVETAQKQHEAVQDNIKQALQQIRAMEARLFDDTSPHHEQAWKESTPPSNTLWSSLFSWN